VATVGGILFAMNWMAALIAIGVWILVFIPFRYVSLGSVVAALSLPVAKSADGAAGDEAVGGGDAVGHHDLPRDRGGPRDRPTQGEHRAPAGGAPSRKFGKKKDGMTRIVIIGDGAWARRWRWSWSGGATRFFCGRDFPRTRRRMRRSGRT